MDLKIIQIIPADGWVSEYERDGMDSERCLICFALVEDKQGVREIKGVFKWGPDTCFCEDDPEFTGYAKL